MARWLHERTKVPATARQPGRKTPSVPPVPRSAYAFRDDPDDTSAYLDRSDPEGLFVRHIAIAETTFALMRRFGSGRS